MTTQLQMNARTMALYCKVPYTNIYNTFYVQSNMTITEFLEYANINIKTQLEISREYDVEVVQTGNNINGDAELAPAIEPSYDVTLEDKFGEFYNTYKIISFYIRPVHPITREFIWLIEYDEVQVPIPIDIEQPASTGEFTHITRMNSWE